MLSHLAGYEILFGKRNLLQWFHRCMDHGIVGICLWGYGWMLSRLPPGTHRCWLVLFRGHLVLLVSPCSHYYASVIIDGGFMKEGNLSRIMSIKFIWARIMECLLYWGMYAWWFCSEQWRVLFEIHYGNYWPHEWKIEFCIDGFVFHILRD